MQKVVPKYVIEKVSMSGFGIGEGGWMADPDEREKELRWGGAGWRQGAAKTYASRETPAHRQMRQR
jgi:hypothetical protein